MDCFRVFSNRQTLASLVLVSIFISLSFLPACSPSENASRIETVKFGAIPGSGSAALIYIAQEQGFFASNALSVNITDFATGVGTTDAMLKGEVDIAWSAELPVIRKVFNGEKINIIATLSRFNDQVLYGLKDRGITDVANLSGKKIGVPRNTIAEFYLARFLQLNGIDINDVSLADVQPPQSLAALTSDNVDGVVTWEPFSSQIKTQLADRMVAWPVQSSQPGFGVITARNEWIKANPEVVRRFLKSLLLAEEFLVQDPQAARSIVQKWIKAEDSYMDIIWPTSEFIISLDQALVTAMEDEARWMIGSNLTTEKTVPDFLDFIDESALKAVNPEAVNVIR